MKILIVNNGTKIVHNFTRILSEHEVDVVRQTGLKSASIKHYDAAILSGSSEYSIELYRHMYAVEEKIIIEASIPILGICLGFELIIDAFGGQVRRHTTRTKGVKKIILNQSNRLFTSLHKPVVYQNHTYRVEAVPGDFEILAHSETGIEAIRHKKRCVYGVQFHPEVYPNRTDGPIILDNFLKIAADHNSLLNMQR